MKQIDIEFPVLADYLAFEEWFLMQCDNTHTDDYLWCWQSPEDAVVLGYGNAISKEVNVTACEKAGVPIYRRCSGGGTVFQSAGCFSYSLFICLDNHPSYASIPAANASIMTAIQAAFGPQFVVNGITDLCLSNLKVAGHAQKRLKRYGLFHGVALVDVDINLISTYLSHPSIEPDYRGKRSHYQFVTMCGLSAATLFNQFSTNFKTKSVVLLDEFKAFDKDILSLKNDKYTNLDWIYRLRG